MPIILSGMKHSLCLYSWRMYYTLVFLIHHNTQLMYKITTHSPAAVDLVFEEGEGVLYHLWTRSTFVDCTKYAHYYKSELPKVGNTAPLGALVRSRRRW